MAVLDKQKLIGLYRKRAGHYDVTANLYYLIGFREWSYRRKAVDALNLRPGDGVVEIGCGTGMNFSLLERAVGPKGRIIGVDLTDAMLEQAKQRVRENGWPNVELVHSDAAAFQFPENIGGIFSTFALTLVPEFDTVIRNGCRALVTGKRWVILDFKMLWPALSVCARRRSSHAAVRSSTGTGRTPSLGIDPEIHDERFDGRALRRVCLYSRGRTG